ncbi:MAG: ATP synthase subunit I [Neisseriaceae bacterium]|jgi:F0F1-type ATP synthase assembly protein I
MIKCSAKKKVLNKELRYCLSLQLVISVIFCLFVLLLFKNLNIAFSSIIGSMIVIITNFSYYVIAFSKGLVVKPGEALSLHKKAMIAKFALNIVIFMLVFVLYKKCNYPVLFIAYIITQSSNWLMLLKK